MHEIIVENAQENNLKNVTLRIPHYRLIVVTGVSGSGKTSLVYDVICAEGQRLFFENFIGGRHSSAKLSHPKASRIEGLFPVISIDQNNVVRSPRSTVGTLTELYDMMRLLFARLGTTDIPELHLHRSLFSFNLPDGYCPVCKGLGVQDHIDPELLIADESKTIREGAFTLTTPNNYIIYSQVTMEVLNQVCNAEGFSVDIPWKDLTPAQKNIVLNGSSRIKVLFGKHPLESRLKWTGITAKPREEDYYKGILPVMEDILRRDRNPNIMRFARSHPCEKCGGKRLNEEALSVKLWGRDISTYAEMSIKNLHQFFTELSTDPDEKAVVEPVREGILKRTALLMKLGAGHLALDRESTTLSGGEAQRIRLANLVSGGIRNVLYILDEPSVGLHPSEHRDLLEVLRSLVEAGNTVLLVDHDEQSIRDADWIIDMGPGAGNAGGRILFNGPAEHFFSQTGPDSLTRKYILREREIVQGTANLGSRHFFGTLGADKNNLRKISPRFLLQAFNVITGVSGSGKTSLVEYLLEDLQKRKSMQPELFRKIIHIDASPIGRTPKSNPATYTGMSDHIRDLMASLPESQQRGFKKGQFSFVIKGGRCEGCGGAGLQQIGMHFLGNVEVICETCNGKRFTEETLAVKYKGCSIFDILELTIDEAHQFFAGHIKITSITGILSELGLGYLKLGQPSTTLSGGEAQRVKLAYELSRSTADQTLYVLDEPTTGLHMADIEVLLKALRKLVDKGNTLLCIEHDPSFILRSDWMVDLGPGSAGDGGEIVMQGTVQELLNHQDSLTAIELRRYLSPGTPKIKTLNHTHSEDKREQPIELIGVETNNLKGVDVSFELSSITAVTGVSGSGKSSLVYGTLYAESQQRFMEGLSSYNRQFTVKAGIPVLKSGKGLIPAISLRKKNPVKNPRSIIATYTGLYDLYRLLFSRLSTPGKDGQRPLSTAFSFNSEEGACPVCKGLGKLVVCDADKLVTDPRKSLLSGALDGSKTGRFYGDPYGQYVAALQTAGKARGVDFSVPYDELSPEAVDLAMNGCGDTIFNVEWKYKRGAHEGIHHLDTVWPGFLTLVENEYIRKHDDARGEALLDLMKSVSCSTCKGYRLKPGLLEFRVGGLHIGQLTELSTDDAVEWFSGDFPARFESELEKQAASVLRAGILERLSALQQAGLGYISTNRIVATLSGGEFQRLQLAGLVRAPLTGVAYILDEPSFGLHPKDIQRVTDLVLKLKALGNTIIMVDHSPLMVGISDYTLELGPGAGSKGGELLYKGITGKHQESFYPEQDKPLNHANSGKTLSIRKAYANNLRQINVEISSGMLTAITGVSGSGKTSLLENVIYQSFASHHPVNCEDFQGRDNFSALIFIEQPAPGSGYTSTVGSMLGLTEGLAKIFAASEEGRKRGFKPSCFIPGSRDGRCPVCEGTGFSKVSMDFFSDIISPCERCGGTGFRDEVLEVLKEGKTIYQALQLPFDENYSFFKEHGQRTVDHKVLKMLELIDETGLGHLSPGRSLRTLSNGELQRLKLVSGLSTLSGKNALILLDEPTGGLHPKDIKKLLNLFNALVSDGHTLVCVTHEPLVMAAAAKTIELGPGGGKHGGMIMGGQ